MAPGGSGPLYAKDERVLCFHLELLYEAKVLDSKAKDDKGYLYKVHYKGWKNTYVCYVWLICSLFNDNQTPVSYSISDSSLR